MKPVTTISGQTESTGAIDTHQERAFSYLRVKYSLPHRKLWNKVGYHIGLLLMAALQYLAPEFLEEGRLCWLRSPLYIVKDGKKETYYFTDEEYQRAYKSGLIKGEVLRAKGLGALSADQAHKSMFDENFQRLETLIPNEESIELLYDLMGEKVEPRKEFIFNNIDFSEIKE